MKSMKWLAASLSLGLIVACGGDSKTGLVNNGQDSMEANRSVEPLFDTEQTADVTIKLGNHTYMVSVHRFPDKKQPLVVDELEQKFYDNSVDIKVLRDGEDFLTKKITKEAFSELLSESDFKNGILLGMSCDTARCDRSTLCFTAQVGQAGEGPAFLLLVPTNGGEPKVQRDNLQEEIGYKE